MRNFRFHGSRRPTRRSVLNAAPVTLTNKDVTVLRLHDPIDSWGEDWGVSAKEFVAVLDTVSTPEIHLHINSPGGEVFEAITIVNALRRHPARVVAVVDGIAASCASFLACSADETVMGQQAQLMIHDAWGGCIGNAGDMRGMADLLDRQSDNIAGIYAAKAGTDVADWRAAMVQETWYSADEAVAAGLADRVEESVPAPGNTFDLSVFKAAPGLANESPSPAPDDTEPALNPAANDRTARHRANTKRPESRRSHPTPSAQ